MKTITAILLGAGGRGNAYSTYALKNPEELRIVGVAESDDVRRNEFKNRFDLADEKCFHTWQDVFTMEKWADVVMICTQDAFHFDNAMAAIEKGYDLLLEKPITTTAAQCRELAAAARTKGAKVLVCHLIRYAPFFMTIKDIIDSGEIGDIVTISLNENVGDYHLSHSYVRGNWSNKERSAPMILTKSCHDMDLLQWLIGKKCLRLSSFGSLKFFNKDNCPPGAPLRCTDGCEVDCPYDAREMYVNSNTAWMRYIAAGYSNPTNEDVLEAIKIGPYGRCVFQCDNDVVDHQVVSMEFEDGVTVAFTMSGFTPDISRTIKIMGTKGQIRAHTTHQSIEISKFVTHPHTENREIILNIEEDGHGGGDTGVMKSFCSYIRGDCDDQNLSEIGISAENHLLCFAAEESRINNGAVVEMSEYGCL